MHMAVAWVFFVVVRGGGTALLGYVGYRLGRRNTLGAHITAALLCGLWGVILFALAWSAADPFTLVSLDGPYRYMLLLNAWNTVIPVVLGWYMGWRKNREAAFLLLEVAVIIFLASWGTLGLAKHPYRVQRFREALGQGDKAALARIIRAGIDPNMGFEEGVTPLHIAWEEGDRDTFEFLLEHGAIINGTPPLWGYSVLSEAVRDGSLEDVEYLVGKGARWDQLSSSSNPLSVALRNRRQEIVKLLLLHGDPAAVSWDSYGFPLSILMGRIEEPGGTDILEVLLANGFGELAESVGYSPFGRWDQLKDERTREFLVRFLLEHKMCPHSYDSRYIVNLGYPAMVLAPLATLELGTRHEKSDLEFAGLLKALLAGERAEFLRGIEAQGLVDSMGDLGFTPLHAAAYLGDVEAARGLLRLGANPNARTSIGETPLHVAARWDHLALAELLLEGAAAIDAQDEVGETPLHTALRHERADFAEWLREEGADEHVLDLWGRPAGEPIQNHGLEPDEVKAIFDLIARGDVHGLREALDAGLDVNFMSDESLLHAAVRSNQQQVVSLLLERGASVETMVCLGRETPLHLSVREGHADLAQLLLGRGAPIEKRDYSGRTPLHSAILSSRPVMVELLCRSGANMAASYSSQECESYPLELAVREKARGREMVGILLRFGANPEKVVVRAAVGGDTNALEVLLEHEIDPWILHTALHRVLVQNPHEAKNSERIKDLLLKAGADMKMASWDWSPNAPEVRSRLMVRVRGNGQAYVRFTGQEAPGFGFSCWKIPRDLKPVWETDDGRIFVARADSGVFPMSQSESGRAIATVFVEPAPGWAFEHWEGDLPDGAEPKAIAVTVAPGQDRTIVAVLRKVD